MTKASLTPSQQQALDAMRQQQDAYLAAARAWRDASADASSMFSFDEMPEPPSFGAAPGFEELPSAAELMEANQLFMKRMFEEQQRFFASLNDILGRN